MLSSSPNSVLNMIWFFVCWLLILGSFAQASMSNASQVVIRNVGFGLSGNFSCEVTADAPSFSTALVHVQMQVVGKLCNTDTWVVMQSQ